jgi:hypothetical protein
VEDKETWEGITAWPSYHVKNAIIKMMSSMPGFVGSGCKSFGEVAVIVEDSKTLDAIKQVYGDIFRGVRIKYEIST